MPKPIKNIAVIRLSAMGDVAMTVPVLRAFSQQFPNIRITVVSRPFFKPFFEDIPNVSFFAVDLTKRHKSFFGLLKLYSDLKELGIDAVADLHQVMRSKIVRTLFALSGIQTASLDKAREDRKALTRSKNKIFKPLPTVFEQHAKVFAQLGFPIDLNTNSFPKTKDMGVEIQNVIGGKTGNFIGIAPFAQHQSKVYPQDLMNEVIEQLSNNKQDKIILFGGGLAEIQVLNEFANHRSNVIAAAGKVNFKQELELISNLDVMLSMDSGNAHIAAMYGVKTITLWGATHPFAGFSPFLQPLENALVSDRAKYPKLPTSIYGNKKVEGYDDVMRTISPSSVVAKIQELLR